MGLGDAVIPTVLVISANSFMSAPAIGFINVPAFGAAVGTIVGYAVLMWFVLKGKPQAGLPFLNSGAIGGFLIASYIVGVKPF
jgi:presenilin-like A22 family membrane protease